MIIADTGYWLALANSSDRHHAAAKAALAELREPLVTTWPVMTETCHLLAHRLGSTAHERFIESAAQGAFTIFTLEPTHLPRILVLLKKYRDLPMDLADASLVILAEELGSGKILSTDTRAFRACRWKTRKPFRNLLKLS